MTQRPPKNRCTDEVMHVMERAMSLHAAGHRAEAIDVLVTVCHTDGDAFSTACGFASAIAAHAKTLAAGDADDGGASIPVVAHVSTAPENTDRGTLLGAFIAGAGNNDLQGVALSWLTTSLETKVRVLLDLFELATLIATSTTESGQ